MSVLHQRQHPALLATQPLVTLDVLIGDVSVPLDDLTNHGMTDDNCWPTWLEEAPIDILLGWVRQAPTVRAPRVAALCRFDQKGDGENAHSPAASTWPALAQRLIDTCPDRRLVLQAFADRLLPDSWGGSRAEIVERRRILFTPYLTDTEAAVAAWAREFDAKAHHTVSECRAWEQEQDQRAQRFE